MVKVFCDMCGREIDYEVDGVNLDFNHYGVVNFKTPFSAPSELTQRYGKPGTLTCHNRRAPCNRRNVGSTDFCSYGEPKEV